MTAPALDVPVPRPRITARGVAVAAACWVLYALLYASVIAASEAAPFMGAFIGQLMGAAVLAALSVPAWLLVVRRMDRARGAWQAVAHLVIAPLYAFLGLEALLWITRRGAGEAVAAEVGENYVWIWLSYAVLYALQFALYHAVRAGQRLRQKEREAAALAALAQEREFAALKAQVNPHFLFNTLNSISATVKERPDEAREMIAQLAGLLRRTLRRSGQDGGLVPLRDEVRFAQAYLDLERRRFPDRLRVVYDVEEAALDALVPPMTLQPLVENAVRHGIAPSEAGGTVTLRVTRPNGCVRVSIEDTGAGPPAAFDSEALRSVNGSAGGIGLANTSARLERLFGPEAALHAAARAPHGFGVWFSLPDEPDR